jgi:hypothetical protein
MDVIERSRVEVPGHVARPFQVYLNGVLQQEGRDFRQEGNALVFDRPLEEEGRLGFIRWLSMALGIAGTYRKDDKVDLAYESGGRKLVETGLRFERVTT